MSNVRVRFAPSPTGLLHIGGLRTALYNYLFARKHRGVFILRVEDTDQERYVADAEPDIMSALAWADLTIDEGPEQGGEVGPYRQSERKALYHKHVQMLLDQGRAYYAFDTPEALTAMRERLTAAGQTQPAYNAETRGSMINSLTLSQEEVKQKIEQGEPYVVRLRVEPGSSVTFRDAVRGEVTFQTEEVDDQVLLKSDGMPTYHLANIVDDHLMGITHVIRGEEWLPSTPKHILLYEAFGWEAPQMAHLPLILSPTGGKLSKRNAEKQGIPVSVRQYIDAGYEAPALINFLAFLGWNPGTEQELFTLDELVDAFSLDRVGSAGVQFNLDKLRWYNEQYMRGRPDAEIAADMKPHVEAAGYEADETYLTQVAALMKERLTFPSDILEEGQYWFRRPDSYSEKAVKKQWKEQTSELLEAYGAELQKADEFTHDGLEVQLKDVANRFEVSPGRLLAPLRLALAGEMTGPGVYDMMLTLGREETLARIRQIRETLG